MTVPTINIVTTTATTSAPISWTIAASGSWGYNTEITTSSKLDFGVLNIDSNAWSAVKPIWGYVSNMQSGNTSIANMGFYCDGLLTSGMIHYDYITSTWVNPSSTGNVQLSGSSASSITAGAKHTVLESDDSATLEASGDRTQYIYVQYSVASNVATGQKTTAAATGRPTFAFTYS